ncbi:MAG: Crp/Fnr family transcriptional regulator [Candidatus Gastranaerophilales bacterium]|nr:Crp/Fnr family transcriptional regulator [Candidatus Gastranaerophilales bacterium]
MQNSGLFEKIENNEIIELLKCIGIKTKVFKKNSYILRTSAKIDFLGVILEGNAVVSKTDLIGNTVIIEKLKTDDIFGHNIVCCETDKSPVNIIAKSNCEVLFLPFEKIVTPCEKLCPFHLRLIKNVMKMISKKNSILNDKIDIIAQKTIRDKILAFLQTYKKEEGIFSIPYSREEMAKFLCADRSALSRELSKMQDEGILRFKKNCFEILNY